MYMSPVIFPLSMVQEGSTLRRVIELNPMTAVLEGFRSLLLGTAMDWSTLAYPCLFTAIVLGVGLAVFQRVQRSFSDVI
jgi:lipopolysaccharide transport system permease protein